MMLKMISGMHEQALRSVAFVEEEVGLTISSNSKTAVSVPAIRHDVLHRLPRTFGIRCQTVTLQHTSSQPDVEQGR